MITLCKVKVSHLRGYVLHQELHDLVAIAQESFSGMRSKSDVKHNIDAINWLYCNLVAYPRTNYYVAKFKEKIIGYILWIEHGGFRKEAYIELEQIAVKKEIDGQQLRGMGIGSMLIAKSLKEMQKQIAFTKRKLKTIKVTTGHKNKVAQGLYEKMLGVKIENTVKSPYHEGELEVEMFVRY